MVEKLVEHAKELAIKYNQKKGLIKIVQNAIDIVVENPDLIKDEKIREKFINQNAKKAAKSLCTTIIRYIYLILNIYMRSDEYKLPKFELYWIDLINKRCYKLKRVGRPPRKVFTYYKNEHDLMSKYLDITTYFELKKNSHMNSTQTRKLIAIGDIKLAMFRNYINTHTWLGILEGDSFTRIDSYHLHKIGIKIKGKMRWFYCYITGVNR